MEAEHIASPDDAGLHVAEAYCAQEVPGIVAAIEAVAAWWVSRENAPANLTREDLVGVLTDEVNAATRHVRSPEVLVAVRHNVRRVIEAWPGEHQRFHELDLGTVITAHDTTGADFY